MNYLRAIFTIIIISDFFNVTKGFQQCKILLLFVSLGDSGLIFTNF